MGEIGHHPHQRGLGPSGIGFRLLVAGADGSRPVALDHAQRRVEYPGRQVDQVKGDLGLVEPHQRRAHAPHQPDLVPVLDGHETQHPESHHPMQGVGPPPFPLAQVKVQVVQLPGRVKDHLPA